MAGKDYISEIEDAFGEKLDTKAALKIAKTIKSTHKLAYPKKEFKNILKGRLQESFFISQADELPSRFSIFQIIGVFGSFIFIVGALATVYNIRETPQAVLLQEKVMQESRVSEDSIAPDIYEDENIEVRSIEQIESLSEIPDDVEEVPYLESKAQFIEPEKKEVIPEKAIDPGEAEKNFTNILGEENTQESTIIEESSGTPKTQDFSQDTSGTLPENTLPAASASMISPQGEDDIQDASEIPFAEICGEYGGKIDEEVNTCILPSGTQCKQENIYECANQDVFKQGEFKDDTSIEEPKGESGQ